MRMGTGRENEVWGTKGERGVEKSRVDKLKSGNLDS
jgi:hypothetical protein